MDNYRIVSDQIGNGILGKVHLIQLIQKPFTLLIAKIFDEQSEEHYNKERNILTIISNSNNPNKNYIIQIKNIIINLDFMNYFLDDSRYLLFDYLEYGNLSKYLYNGRLFTDIPEKFTKLVCYKLLKAFEVMHDNHIIHNKIDINNIMFNNDFNPIIIHFSEAVINNDYNDNNYKIDFRGLGKIAAKMITSGRFMHLRFNKVKKYFEIIDNAKRAIIEKDFWNSINKISEVFIDFFDKLLKSRTPLNINELINHPWLKEIKDIYDNNINNNSIENDFKNFFLDKYKKIKLMEQQDKQTYEIDAIIDMQNNSRNNGSLINDIMINGDRGCSAINDKSEIFNLNVRKINNMPKGFLFDYIEIIINDKNNYNNNYDKLNFFYCFIYDLQLFIEKMENLENKVEYSEEYLSFNATFKEKLSKGNEEIIGADEMEDDLMLEEDEIENLEMKIELLKYKKDKNEKNNIDNDEGLVKYYLIFNYIQGEISDYYHYMAKIKEKAKEILEEKLRK